MPRRYSCLIVDDESLGRDLIAAHLAQLPQFELTASCADAIEAAKVLHERNVDLMFLDIEMPEMKGTDFYLGLSNPPAVIFTTAYRDYAVQGFDLEAVDYLLKPIVFPRFFKATQRFLAQQKLQGLSTGSSTGPVSNADDDLFIRVNRKYLKVRRADILYVRSMGDYQQVHTLTARYMVKSTISGLAEKLGQGFLRIHRSYLVNRRHISSITRDEIHIEDIELPVSDGYRAAVTTVVGGSPE
ncbi:MAG: LytTR family DNA-binding domain-containing protein [Pseudomonadota bacterium]